MFGQFNYQIPYQTPMQQPMQTVQRMHPLEPMVKCWFVNNKQEFDVIRADYNTIFIGINTATKEIYTKQLMNNGTTEFLTYNQQQAETVEENNDIKAILQKLSNIENKLGGSNESNATNVNATNNVRSVQQQPTNANVSTNDAGQEQTRPNTDTH